MTSKNVRHVASEPVELNCEPYFPQIGNRSEGQKSAFFMSELQPSDDLFAGSVPYDNSIDV